MSGLGGIEIEEPFLSFKGKSFFESNSLPTYFGIGNRHLDIITMQYRMVGAVWQIHNGYRYIIIYIQLVKST